VSRLQSLMFRQGSPLPFLLPDHGHRGASCSIKVSTTSEFLEELDLNSTALVAWNRSDGSASEYPDGFSLTAACWNHAGMASLARTTSTYLAQQLLIFLYSLRLWDDGRLSNKLLWLLDC
jgi:hypothetical protein